MRHKHYTINITLSIILIAIITNQAIWIINMYYSYKKEIVQEMNTTVEKAIYMEVTERSEKEGGFGAFPLYPENGDTTRYIQKKIIGEDTTFVVTIDRQDPNANLKIVQYLFNETNYSPININRINGLFSQEMQKGKFPVQKTYIEYYNLQADTLIESTLPVSIISYLSSDMITIDIMNSMGIKASIENPIMSILGRMVFQLVLSILLILIAITGLFLLGRTIYVQWKQEKMRQDAINSMTHEFKRPISTAVSMISLIPYYLQKKNIEKANTYATNTLQELNKLTAYTERIQQISNNDRSTVYLNYTDIEIRPFFNAMKEKYCRSEKDKTRKQINIQLNLNTIQTHLHADLLHFSNVIDNLIENAIKYSGNMLTVILSVTDINNSLKISVKDNGIGISQSDKKYIFDKYYRSKTRFARQKTGFGLGLTYVKSIIEAHNGNIEVNSTVGEGSEFIIYLPVKN